MGYPDRYGNYNNYRPSPDAILRAARQAVGSCTACGHAPHQHVCLNMASDNDCDCMYATPLEPSVELCEHVWTPVLIENRPVGVHCAECDETVPIAAEPASAESRLVARVGERVIVDFGYDAKGEIREVPMLVSHVNLYDSGTELVLIDAAQYVARNKFNR